MHFYWAAQTGIKYVIHIYSGIYTCTTYVEWCHQGQFCFSFSLILFLDNLAKKNVFFLPVAGCLVAYCCAAGIYIYTAALTWHESVFFSFNYAKKQQNSYRNISTAH